MTENTAIEKAKTKILTLKNLLASQSKELAKAAPRHLDINRLMRIVVTAVAQNPKLLECSVQSILSATTKAAEFGLIPDSISREGYLIPFWSTKNNGYECTFMTGYKGVIKLAVNAGFVVDVDVKDVYERDTFDYRYGLNPDLVHIPFRGGDRGKFVAAYAIATIAGGMKKFDVLEIADAEKHRDKFATTKNKKGEIFGNWVENFESMAMKTVAIRVCKFCAASADPTTYGRDQEAFVSATSYDNGDTIEIELPEEIIEPPRQVEQTPDSLITKQQLFRIKGEAKKQGWESSDITDVIKTRFKKNKEEELTVGEGQLLLDAIMPKVPEMFPDDGYQP